MSEADSTDVSEDPRRLMENFLRRLETADGLVAWDEYCAAANPDLGSGARIRRFAEQHERWPMPEGVNFTTTSVLLWLAIRLRQHARNWEFLAAFEEAEARKGLNPNRDERQALQDLEKSMEEVRRIVGSFTSSILGAIDELGPMNWREVSDATRRSYDDVRSRGRDLVKAGYLERLHDHRLQLTSKGAEELRRLRTSRV